MVVSAGTNKVDSVTEVTTDETATVVKSVTTIGTRRVGMSPFTTKGLNEEVIKFKAEDMEAAAAVMFDEALLAEIIEFNKAE